MTNQKKLGKVAILSQLISGLLNNNTGLFPSDLILQKNMLLTNGGKPPIPLKMLNQRQKRNKWRSNPYFANK